MRERAFNSLAAFSSQSSASLAQRVATIASVRRVSRLGFILPFPLARSMRFDGLLELAVEIDLGEQLIESVVKRVPRPITELVRGHPERVLLFPLSLPKCHPRPSQSGTIKIARRRRKSTR